MQATVERQVTPITPPDTSDSNSQSAATPKKIGIQLMVDDLSNRVFTLTDNDPLPAKTNIILKVLNPLYTEEDLNKEIKIISQIILYQGDQSKTKVMGPPVRLQAGEENLSRFYTDLNSLVKITILVADISSQDFSTPSNLYQMRIEKNIARSSSE